MLGVICHCVKIVRIMIFSGPYFPAFSPNAGKYGLEKLGIRTLFTQRVKNIILRSKWTFLITNDPLDIFKNDWKYRNWFVAGSIRLLFFFFLFFFFLLLLLICLHVAHVASWNLNSFIYKFSLLCYYWAPMTSTVFSPLK